MKKRQMNSLAASLCAYLCSRNNDIAGYWGIGKLCEVARRERKRKFSFKFRPSELIQIYGYEITNSRLITDKLAKFDLDSIEGRLSFLRMDATRTERRNIRAASLLPSLRIGAQV